MTHTVSSTSRQMWQRTLGGADRQRAWLVCRFLFLTTLIALCFNTSARAEDYILGPQDTLKIRVYEWRPVTGTAYEWVPLNGDFAISAAGNLSLPIIGTVPAAGMTLEQVANSIGERLQAQVGLQKRPNASVEVSEYRPFFVTGLVSKPGKYSYSPGLTIVQALSMAGGMFGPVDASSFTLQHDALVSRGDLRTLQVERLGLLARQGRLDAITHNQPSITFPEELTKRAGQSVVDRMMREEQDLFDTRQQSMSAEFDALNQAKVLATNEIETLKAKSASLAKQIDLANKDVGAVSKLIAQGLTVSSRQLTSSQNLADLESRNLDVSLAILRAQQDIAKVARDTADVHNRYRVDALTEAAQVRDQLAANAEKAETARTLLQNIEIRSPVAANVAADDGPGSFVTTVDRTAKGATHTIPAKDNDPVLPGDVIRVERWQGAPGAPAADDGFKPSASP